jgi:bifunctional non-homologous end joining protein LigD
MEGVVCKRDDSRYLPGRRSPTWIKTVIPHTADVVICGWLPGRGRLQGSLGALLLGAYDRHGRLHYVGRVGTGLTGTERRRLQTELTGVRRSTAPVHAESVNTAAANWVEPVLVARVAYRTWTPQAHLRHPSWRGLQPDHEPGQVLLPDDVAGPPVGDREEPRAPVDGRVPTFGGQGVSAAGPPTPAAPQP